MKDIRSLFVAALAAAALVSPLVLAGCGGSGRETGYHEVRTPRDAAGRRVARSPEPVSAGAEAASRPRAARAERGEGGGSAAEPQSEVETADLDEKLVIEGWITLKVEGVRDAAEAIRERTERAGGRVVSETLSVGERRSTGTLKLRVPPEGVENLSDGLEDLGDVKSRRIQGTDVSRELFDQQIALDNLELTLDRLRALLDREDLEMSEILSIEKEMTRLRGEIETIKGENRWLRDRVALATLEIELEQEQPREDHGQTLDPEAKMYPGARASLLTLLDPDGRDRNRLGAGLVVHPFSPAGDDDAIRARMTFEADVFESADGDRQSLLVTVGGDAYSEFFGDGRNLFFNPYLGARLGYGYLDRSAFAFAATAGVEVVKTKYFLFDLNLRGVGLAGRGGFDPALVSGANLVFAF